MANKPPVISLITDFGLKDEYVGVLKGVILSLTPNARIVDISHLIPPQDVRTASHLLARSWTFFPPGTVHMVIVDPGVGSPREILAIAADSHFFIGPDNGIFTPVLLSAASLSAYKIDSPDLYLDQVSSTFHGRDIMAPIAARLADGLDISVVGQPIPRQDCVHSLQRPKSCPGDMFEGEVVHVDHFGNLCTNISKGEVENFASGKEVLIRVNHELMIPLYSAYTAQSKGKSLALFDSHGSLEIAVNQGSAERALQAAPGTKVLLTRH